MANEYLLMKWRLWFKCMDRQHKGQLSKEDEIKEKEAFVKLSNLEGERKKKVIEVSRKLWNQFVFHGKEGPVTEQDFIDMTKEDFKNDKVKFEENVRNLCIEDLNAIDQTGEGSLTEESFLNIYKAAGFQNDDWNKKFFQAYNPVDGKVPFEHMINAWVQFLVSEDSSKKDIIFEILKEYPGL